MKNTMSEQINSHRPETRLEYLEDNRRYIQNALEMALSLGDFQEEINKSFTPVQIFQETAKRVRRLIRFDALALYFVDQNDSDLEFSLCEPAGFGELIQGETEFMIDGGFMAWAIRERRGVSISSRDQTRQVLLHVIATHSRIRGMFVGVYPAQKFEIPDASLDLLSIILRNTANALERIEFYDLMRHQERILKEKVDQKTKEILTYERHLQQARKMEAIGTLAGGVAHDLNNVLGGIVGYPDLLLMQIPKDSPLRKPIEIMRETGIKAAAIVDDLLTLARRGVPTHEAVDLNNVILEYLEGPMCENLRKHHPRVEVKIDLESDLLSIWGSPVHLSKTLMNLMSNAAEAMPEGGTINIITKNRYIDGTVKGWEEIAEGDCVVLQVSDSGEGIPPEDMDRIFEPFYTKKVMGRSGTGLGMTVVWGTVKDHKGHIDVKSAVGVGTTFTLYFPGKGPSSGRARRKLDIREYMGRGETILVVDDEKRQREIAYLMLTELGYSVSTISSGEEAVEYLKSNSADLLLLDMIMDPGIDGLETYRQILKLHPGQKAIIASGFADRDRVKKAQELGAGPDLKKPYTLEKLCITVRNAMDDSALSSCFRG